MAEKRQAQQDAEITRQEPRPDPQQGVRVSETGSAQAPLLFFDRAAFFGLNPGAGGNMTLTAERITTDADGRAIRENVVVAYLRAPMDALRQLRENIDLIEKMEAEYAAAAIAAAGAIPPPSGMAH